MKVVQAACASHFCYSPTAPDLSVLAVRIEKVSFALSTDECNFTFDITGLFFGHRGFAFTVFLRSLQKQIGGGGVLRVVDVRIVLVAVRVRGIDIPVAVRTKHATDKPSLDYIVFRRCIPLAWLSVHFVGYKPFGVIPFFCRATSLNHFSSMRRLGLCYPQ